MPVLAHAIEESTDIFGISEGGGNTPNPPRYATDSKSAKPVHSLHICHLKFTSKLRLSFTTVLFCTLNDIILVFKRRLILSQVLVRYSNSRVLRRQTSQVSDLAQRNKIRK